MMMLRECIVDDMPALFHRWVPMSSSIWAIVEFENGSCHLVLMEQVSFKLPEPEPKKDSSFGIPNPITGV